MEEAARWSGDDDGDEVVIDGAASAGWSPPEALAAARVLLVDDNADLRTYVAGLLSRSFPNVATARDGQHALEQVAIGPPDLVVSDLMMPRLDGFGLVRALRADPRTRAIPIILLSARAGDESTVEGLASSSRALNGFTR